LNPLPLQAVEPRAPQLLFTLSNTHPSAVPPPHYSSQKQAVNLEVATLDSLAVGGRIVFDLHAQGRVALEIQRSNVLINSDRVIEASTTLDGTHVQLTLTFSGTSLFGHLKAGDDVFQLQAALGARDYEGWFYRPSSLQGQHLQNDSILIKRRSTETQARLPPLSLRGLSGVEDARETASLHGSDGGSDPLKMTIESGSAVNGLTISHGFSRRAVYRGGNVTATVEVVNSLSPLPSATISMSISYLRRQSCLGGTPTAPSRLARQRSASSAAILARCRRNLLKQSIWLSTQVS
jgi:hypothetical protein